MIRSSAVNRGDQDIPLRLDTLGDIPLTPKAAFPILEGKCGAAFAALISQPVAVARLGKVSSKAMRLCTRQRFWIAAFLKG